MSLDAARAVLKELREAEHELAHFTCPVCGAWVECCAEADAFCSSCRRVMRRDR